MKAKVIEQIDIAYVLTVGDCVADSSGNLCMVVKNSDKFTIAPIDVFKIGYITEDTLCSLTRKARQFGYTFYPQEEYELCLRKVQL